MNSKFCSLKRVKAKKKKKKKRKEKRDTGFSRNAESKCSLYKKIHEAKK